MASIHYKKIYFICFLSHYFVDFSFRSSYTVPVVERNKTLLRRRFNMFELKVGDLIKFDSDYQLSPNYDTIVKVRPKSVVTICSGIVKIKNIINVQKARF